MTNSGRTAAASCGQTLVPLGWEGIEGLLCGFGDRRHRPPAGTVLLEKQVHGTKLVDVDHVSADGDKSDPGDGLIRLAAEADGLLTASPGTTVGVRTADCVPVLLVAPDRGWSAAVHAGWRGTLAGIVVEAVEAARGVGVAGTGILAALGPSIGPCCYEVSIDLGQRFSGAGLGPSPLSSSSHASPLSGSSAAGPPGPHLDLRAANRTLLERSGLSPANIQNVGPCTKCAADRYHSFRAEPESAGRQVSWIGWRGREDRRPAPDHGRPR